MCFSFNPDAEEFIPKVEEEHRHRGECYGYSGERGEAGHSVGKQNTPTARTRVSGLGWTGTAGPSHRKSRHVSGHGIGEHISRWKGEYGKKT